MNPVKLLFSLGVAILCSSIALAQRPQTPLPPFPYGTEDVTFRNPSAGATLAGTFTYPQEGAPFPAAVLISGSGPQNRDEEIAGHLPFLVIADHLTRNGIAVLRYDDRGFGESSGNFNAATTADFAQDARAAVAYLTTRDEVNSTQIGVIGHSEGGLISPLVAMDNPDLSFIVSLAGTGISGKEIILLQGILITRAEGVPEEDVQFWHLLRSDIIEIVMMETDNPMADNRIRILIDERLSDFSRRERFEILNQFRQFLTPWFRYFLAFDPYDSWARVTVPVLALNGDKDVQVPPEENLSKIKEAVRSNGNTNITTIVLPNLNHLFQHSETGAISEYELIEETFDVNTLELMTNWIHTTLTPAAVREWLQY